MNDKPLVSIACAVYNHEPFIRQCLDGFVMQKTNFKFEAVVHDDASTDNSANIIREYEVRYPDIIKPIYQKKNYGLGSEHTGRMKRKAWRGKYLAFCEGDDYWTDPLKLQKQVDFLEANEDYSFCYHKTNYIDEKGLLIDKYKGKENKKITHYSKDEIFNIHISTPSLVMRNLFDKYPKEFARVPHSDVFLLAMLAIEGKCADLDFIGANYRIHSGGVYNRNPVVQRYLNTIKTRRIMLTSDYFTPDIKHLIKRQMNKKKKDYLWRLFKKMDLTGFVKVLFA